MAVLLVPRCILCLFGLVFAVGVELPARYPAEFSALDAVLFVQINAHIEPLSENPPGVTVMPTVAPKMPAEDLPNEHELERASDAIQFMRDSLGSKPATYQACVRLNELTQSNILLAPLLLLGQVVEVVTAAMNTWPAAKQLQLACLDLMANIGAWGHDTSGALNLLQGLPPVLNAVMRFGAEEPWIITKAALLENNCLENQRAMNKLGALNIVKQLADTNYRPDMEEAAQCFFSTSCGTPALTASLAKTGYIPRAMKVMGDFPKERGIRGEILTILSGCFLEEHAYLEIMMAHGIVPALIAAATDEIQGLAELDDVGAPHLYNNVLDIMHSLATANSTWQSDLAEAGAIDQINSMMLQLATKFPDGPGTQSVTSMVCPTALNLGRPPVPVSKTCKLLASFSNNMRARETTFKSGVLEVIKSLITKDFVKYDPDVFSSCGSLEEMLRKK